jgi:hypothetical protein
MLELIQWLRENIPAEDASAGSRTGIVHGDFRLDNLVFHPTEVSLQEQTSAFGPFYASSEVLFLVVHTFFAVISFAFVQRVPSSGSA